MAAAAAAGNSGITGNALSTRAGSFFVESPLSVTEDYDDVPAIENSSWETHCYARYFARTPHDVFIGKHDKLGGAVALTVVRDDVEGFGAQFRIIVWKTDGVAYSVVPISNKEAKALDGGKEWKLKDLLHRLADAELYANYKKFRTVSDPLIIPDLLEIERFYPSFQKQHQFGVQYGAPGQTAEAAMLETARSSPAFDEFLGLLGTRFNVHGYTGFAGSLDPATAAASTGAVSRELHGHEILFLVAPLLPDPASRAQLLGGQTVRIVFVEGTTGFDIESLDRSSTMVLAVVQLRPDDPAHYHVTIAYERGTGLVGPPLRLRQSKSAVFIRNLLVKLINVERAVAASAASRLQITQKAQKTLSKMLEHANKKFYNKKADDYALKGSIAPPGGAPSAGPAAPDSALRLQVILDAFSLPVNCIAPYDEFSLFYGSVDGIFLLDKISASNIKLALTPQQSENVVQLAVLKDEGALLSLAGATPVISIMDVDRAVTKKPRIKTLPQTNRAHLFALGCVGSGQHLCVAVHSEVFVFLWDSFDHTFVELSKIKFPAKPACMEMADDSSGVLCVAFKAQFVLVNLRTEAITPLHEDLASLPLAAFVVSAKYFVGQEPPGSPPSARWLLCYTRSLVLVRVSVDPAGATTVAIEFSARWITPPLSIVLLPPYILATSVCALEVRSLVNGALLETIKQHVLPESTFRSVSAHAGRAIYIPTTTEPGKWRINRYTPHRLLDIDAGPGRHHSRQPSTGTGPVVAAPPAAIAVPASSGPHSPGSSPLARGSPLAMPPPPPGPPPGYQAPAAAAQGTPPSSASSSSSSSDDDAGS